MKLSYEENQISPDEKFKFVSGHNIKPHMYAVSSFGRVVSLKNGKQLKQTNQSGYRCVGLQKSDNARLIITVHRLVAEAFIIKTEEDKQLGRNVVNHKDLHRWNNNVKNLEWVTTAENNEHGRMHRNEVIDENDDHNESNWSKGEITKGSSNGMSRITEFQVCLICKGLELGLPYKIIAMKAGLNGSINDISIISSIHHRKRWKHISKNYRFPPIKRKQQSGCLKEFIPEICKMIVHNYTNKEIYEFFQIKHPKTDYPRDRFFRYLNRIRNGKTHQDILRNTM